MSTNVGAIKHWSSTQRLVALSSCEAHLHAMNKGALEAIGGIKKNLAADIGVGTSFSIELKTDAAAVLGVMNRRGIGKMRHINTLEQLMPKRNSGSGNRSAADHIDGGNIVSDTLTKKVKAEVMEKHIVAMRVFSRNDTVQPRSVQSALAGSVVHQMQQR